jgi:hypothetical protein
MITIGMVDNPIPDETACLAQPASRDVEQGVD